jgi:anaerobic ribonucleoside-triphosphate reductase activating protein
MGGDQNVSELTNLSMIVRRHNLKVALYSGLDDDGISLVPLYKRFDYIKIGHYNQDLGGLDKTTTNQRMYKWNSAKCEWDDITYRFQKGYHNG